MSNDIAVVGMACKFPGANNIEEFWDNIKNGRESIKTLSMEELVEDGCDLNLINNPNYIQRKGIIDQVGCFDAEFFNYSAKDARAMDPQHRLALETCYHAIEDYGFNPEKQSNNIGTFLSSSFGSYILEYYTQDVEALKTKDQHQMCIANSNDFLATKIAYKLNFTGPAQTIQTACSSSLVAVHYACQSLLSYDCDAAIAGGVSVTIPSRSGYLYKKDSIASKDGHCRPFDDAATGTVAGNGVGVVVLKRLEDAINNNDKIYAVIKGSAINNDGSDKMNFTAPSAIGQAKAIIMAQAMAEISPDTIGLIEAHGTATALGDPIEIEGLRMAFSNNPNITFEKGACAITSTKANIGHLDAAAGIASLIKTSLALYNRQIPPSINFQRLNRHINFDAMPFYINTQLKEWAGQSYPRRAGVSAFGIGGTNVHVVLEEASGINDQSNTTNDSCFILPLSAKTLEALQQQKNQVLHYISNKQYTELADIEYTLQQRRITYLIRDCIIAHINNGKIEFLDWADAMEDKIKNLLDADTYNHICAWMNGSEGQWHKYNTKSGGRCAYLPPYPFKKADFWFEKKSIKQTQVIVPVYSDAKKGNAKLDSDKLSSSLANILRNILEVDELDSVANFKDLGAESILLLDFIVQIEEQLGLEVSIADMQNYPSINQLAVCLANKYPDGIKGVNLKIRSNFESLVIEIKDGDRDRPPLWCIHPAGGSTTIFQDFAKYINYNQRVLGIRASGLFEGETPDSGIVEMAQKYIKAIKAAQPKGEYYLLGASLGGTIAFEIAQTLDIQGDKVAMLCMLDSPPPAKSVASVKIPESKEEILTYINSLSPVMAESVLKTDNGGGLHKKFFEVWSCHSRSSQDYTVHRPYKGSVIYLRAKERDDFLNKNMEIDWFQWVENGVELFEVPGNHLTMCQLPNVIRVSEIINRKINNLKREVEVR